MHHPTITTRTTPACSRRTPRLIAAALVAATLGAGAAAPADAHITHDATAGAAAVGDRCAAVRLPAVPSNIPEYHSIGVYDGAGTMVGAYSGAFAVSPDGTTVARVVSRNGTMRIDLTDADGGNVRTVYTFPGTASYRDQRRSVFSPPRDPPEPPSAPSGTPAGFSAVLDNVPG